MIENENCRSQKSSVCSKGMTVVWKNLTVSARIEKPHVFLRTEYTYKEILHEVNGIVEPESLVAVLGPSGSGKSTLMSVLANRNSAALQVDGIITIGGRPKENFAKCISGFVYQDYLFNPILTVTEHLRFTAQLKLGKRISQKVQIISIEEILNHLGLANVAHTRIGSGSFEEGKINLSGGECKRLSIATELITDPGLLFCDEPTTGLDSFTAYNVISYLKSLTVFKQKTIVCAIHQPNAQLFEQFNNIILMCKGKIAFNGSSADAVGFFEEQGFQFQNNMNPATYLLHNLTKESLSENGITRICAAFEKSKCSRKIKELIDDETSRKEYQDSVVFYKSLYSYSSPSWFCKLICLTHRNLLSQSRDLSVQSLGTIIRLALTIFLGLCLHGSVTWTQHGLTSLKGTISLTIYLNFLPSARNVMKYIPGRLILFHREHSNNINTPLLFYLSNIFSLIPGDTVDPVIYTLLLLWLTGLMRSVYTVLICCLTNILLVNTSAAFGMLLAIFFKDLNIANSISSPVEATIVICSGVFVKISSIPWILSWIPHVSWVTNSLEIMFIVLVDGVVNIACDPHSTGPCLRTGNDVLASYDFNAGNLWPDFVKMACILLTLHAVAYITLLRRLRHRTA